jgi:hypothetical protein
VSNLTAATNGANVAVIYDQADPVVRTSTVRKLISKYAAVLPADKPPQHCVLNFTQHSMLSMYVLRVGARRGRTRRRGREFARVRESPRDVKRGKRGGGRGRREGERGARGGGGGWPPRGSNPSFVIAPTGRSISPIPTPTPPHALTSTPTPARPPLLVVVPRYDDAGTNKWWLPDVECKIVDFLAHGAPFEVATATNPTEGNERFCALNCTNTTCAPYVRNHSGPPAPLPACRRR